jgi:predicted O-methyltransferase YrrM
LPRLVEEGAGPFDLVFVDADKPNLPDYSQLVTQLSRPGTLIVIDNVGPRRRRGGRREPRRVGAGRAPDERTIAAEPRVSATTLQTVGGKGYDGLAFVLVER